MNKTRALLAISGLMALAPTSFAADGTIDLTGIIKPTTCIVLTSNVAIPLTSAAGISARTFTGVGSASTWTAAVPLKLDCTGNVSDVFMTVTDATTPSNRSSILSLTAGSAASGIGIELSIFGKPKMSFGPDSAAIGTVNQFKVVDAADANTAEVIINFSARYVQTAARVVSGTANGAATFTMAYQ